MIDLYWQSPKKSPPKIPMDILTPLALARSPGPAAAALLAVAQMYMVGLYIPMCAVKPFASFFCNHCSASWLLLFLRAS